MLIRRCKLWISYVVMRMDGFKICLATNSSRDFSPMAQPLDAHIVQPRFGTKKKPHREFFERILQVFKLQPSQIVMVGDKLEYDTTPANDIGMVSVLVNPLGQDLFLERVACRRLRERWKMRRLGISRVMP